MTAETAGSRRLPQRLPGWLRDPITVFLALGAAIFLGWWLLQPRENDIRITPAIRAALAADHRQLTGHDPDKAEQRGLIDDWVAEEILFREALARGLHLADGTVRERLVERMTLIAGGVPPEPDEADLIDHYARHRGTYVREPQISLEQVYFSKPPADPAAVLARLRAGGAVDGDDFWMGDQFSNFGESMLRGMLGAGVLAGARSAPIGQWMGPLVGPRGVHFIRVTARSPVQPLPYLAAREQVKMDWQAEAAAAPVAREVARVRSRYRIIDAP
jgi:peptidyl-prolyl cis-trans isomerase C